MEDAGGVRCPWKGQGTSTFPSSLSRVDQLRIAAFVVGLGFEKRGSAVRARGIFLSLISQNDISRSGCFGERISTSDAIVVETRHDVLLLVSLIERDLLFAEYRYLRSGDNPSHLYLVEKRREKTKTAASQSRIPALPTPTIPSARTKLAKKTATYHLGYRFFSLIPEFNSIILACRRGHFATWREGE